ncbi:MAG: two-component system, OmpR family, sensor histidine kinase KdpD [Sphingomonadales bacterium]|jgi:two-component system sensor histidine kinase KdpD|nr:two-component system, OmpR family, sensor histidine kinase KdpD [Sphingomonadales bacterium]
MLRGYAEAALLVAASTLAGVAIAPRWGHSAVDLLYLPAVLGAALLAGLGPALFAALASALAYNFFFTAPHLTFRIDDPNDLVTVVILFGVAVITSQLAASVRRQARIAEAHAARNATIAGVARRLLACTTESEIADAITSDLAALFECNTVLVAGRPEPRRLSSAPATFDLTPGDIAVAALVLDRDERAGRGIDPAASTEWQFHPVRSEAGAMAALGLARDDGAPPVRADQLPLLANLLDQLALALERGRLEGEAREFARVRERDKVRSALLLSIGDDLAPPLKAIAQAVDGLKRSGSGDKALVSVIGSEAHKIRRYVSNLMESNPADSEPVQVDAVSIDLFRRAVFRNGEEVHLTPKEYAVLAELAKHPGRVLSHAHLLRCAWGPAQEGQIDYLRVAVRALRQKLERDASRPELIVNEPAVGYRLKTG